jgi:hypothetical protein
LSDELDDLMLRNALAIVELADALLLALGSWEHARGNTPPPDEAAEIDRFRELAYRAKGEAK